MKTLLLGLGNPILSDDAIGVRLAADLGRALSARPELDVIEECSIGGLDLLEVLAGYDRVIALDAVKTRDGVPGAWYRFGLDDLRHTLHLTNVHDVNLATAIELGHKLGMNLPDAADIEILGVEVDDVETFSERMTPALERAYPALAEAILAEVEAIVVPNAARHL